MDCFLRKAELAQNVLDDTTMISLKLDVSVLCRSPTCELALELRGHVTQINILIKTGDDRCESTPLSSLHSHGDSSFFLRDGLADAEVSWKTTVWTYTTFV